MIDLSKLRTSQTENTVINPKELFSILPQKDEKFSYLRDIQTEVLLNWFENRNAKNNIIRMNTGSGKTLVGLLILKSCLNEGKGPAVYIAPDTYLANQVQREASLLGIETTDDPRSVRYLSQKAILVINIHKLFNGLSVFGVGSRGVEIEIGSLLIDDAHACIDKLEDQFSYKVFKTDIIYKQLLALFKSDLEQQSISTFADLENARHYTSMLLPFWALQSKVADIIRVISSSEETKELTYKWPLIKESIKFSDCVISSENIEFSLRVLPINVINSYERAVRKIIVSATLPDDGILVSHLEISSQELEHSITPSSASDIGERMILVPEAIDPDIDKDVIKELLIEYSKEVNVVILVPSKYRLKYWEDVASKVLTADNIEDGVNELRSKRCGIVVMLAKYDGVDLPGDACRILVIDELPDDSREIDKIDTTVLGNSRYIINRKIRKIEQGMGRGIRSNEDYCVILLIGKSLTNHLFRLQAKDFFTTATKAQLELSSELSDQMRGRGIDSIKEAISLILHRDMEWIKTSKSKLLGLKYSPTSDVSVASTFQQAYKEASINNYTRSIAIFQDKINKTDNIFLKAWLKYYMAMFTNFLNPVEAQAIVKSCVSENHQLPLPKDGIQYQKLTKDFEQANECYEFLTHNYGTTNEAIMSVSAILDDLVYVPETYNAFEEAIKNIALHLGFCSERPEKEYGRGPDVLWSLGKLKYLVIECKNGCTTSTIDKHDTNQLNGSVLWFEEKYNNVKDITPILMHPSNIFEYAATPEPRTKIMTLAELERFKEAVMSFLRSITSTGRFSDYINIGRMLKEYKLDRDTIAHSYLTEYKSLSKR